MKVELTKWVKTHELIQLATGWVKIFLQILIRFNF